jgi:hypothetical protein
MRPIAPIALLLVLAAPGRARADRFDLDLSKLGAPQPQVWQNLDPTLSAAQAAQLATNSLQRFAILSSEMALALTSTLLSPAETTGHTGFEIGLESSYAQVSNKEVGTAIGGYQPVDHWPARGANPSGLILPAVHIRKGLPFSFELGTRTVYLVESKMFGLQVEGKWALQEGYQKIPDFGVRFAMTRLLGQRDWTLTASDLDFIASKKFGLKGVISLTPYAAYRITWMATETGELDFGPARPPPPRNPTENSNDDVRLSHGKFPKMNHAFNRYILGARLIARAASIGIEGAYFAGKSFDAGNGYPGFEVPAAFYGNIKFSADF